MTFVYTLTRRCEQCLKCQCLRLTKYIMVSFTAFMGNAILVKAETVFNSHRHRKPQPEWNAIFRIPFTGSRSSRTNTTVSSAGMRRVMYSSIFYLRIGSAVQAILALDSRRSSVSNVTTIDPLVWKTVKGIAGTCRRYDANSRGERNSSPAYILPQNAEENTKPGSETPVYFLCLQAYSYAF